MQPTEGAKRFRTLLACLCKQKHGQYGLQGRDLLAINPLVTWLQLAVMMVQASLEARGKALKRAEQTALQKEEHAQHELALARRECDRAAGDAEDRKVQLSVLVDTVETLQAGTPGNSTSP